jgi:hypothetical protein
MLRRIGVLTSLAVVAVMFAGVSSAQAQTAGVCVFTGLSGTLKAGDGTHTPANNENHGIENIQADVSRGLAGSFGLDVERGSYQFSTGAPAAADCVGLLNGVPTVALDTTITSNGFYDNIVCGTGFAHDLDSSGTTFAALNVGPNAGQDDAGYEIPFVAGNGPLLIGPDGKPPLAALTELLPADNIEGGAHGVHAADSNGGTAMHGNVVSDFVGTGAVHIAAVAPDNCGTANDEGTLNDTDSFEVTGFFVGVKTS